MTCEAALGADLDWNELYQSVVAYWRSGSLLFIGISSGFALGLFSIAHAVLFELVPQRQFDVKGFGAVKLLTGLSELF